MKTNLRNWVLTCILVLQCFSLSVWAAGVEIDGIHYLLNQSEQTASVVMGKSNSGDIVIPETVSYDGISYTVTSIGSYAFQYRTGLTSITIPNSVTSIEEGAFWYCTDLRSISIPESVTRIGEKAFCCCISLTSITIPNSVNTIWSQTFGGCTSLTSITIPNSVTNIMRFAFSGCTGLTSITIPSSVAFIWEDAFKGCIGLTSIKVDEDNTKYDSRDNCNAIIETASNTLKVGCKATTIPNSVTSIGYAAFKGRTGLTSITIPNSVTTIGEGAFSGCTGLTSISIPNSVKNIWESAFEGCTGLTSVTIGNSVTSIGEDAFLGCTSMTSITIPNSVTSIEDGAFYRCTGLTSIKVEEGNTKYDSRDNCNAIIETATNTLIAGCNATTIPNSVTTIKGSAFYGCTGLTSITIPNSVTTIKGSAFYGCSGLTSIKVAAGNTKYDSRDNCQAIIETATNTLIAGCKATTIPNSVTSIGQSAFSDCTGLTSITIPNSVTSIGWAAFSGCTGLTSITIPNSFTTIEGSAFYGCTGLTSITIPNSVTSIGISAFYGCTGLTSITIPNSVTSIESDAFYGCTGLTSITLSWDDPTNCTYGGDILYSVPRSATLYVPAGTKALYENKYPWSSFKNIVERGESVITLNNTMGTYCDASGLDFSSAEGLEAYTATGYASGEVTLTRVNYVPANTGIVLRGTAGVYEVPKQKVSAYLMNLLKGTTSPITLNQTEGDMTNYILANGSKGIGFYKVASGGGTLAANKAYLQLPSNLSATRPMMLRFEDEDGQTTDIQYLYTTSSSDPAPATYDLQGRRVSGTMQQGGIYIVGGKKVIVKSH